MLLKLKRGCNAGSEIAACIASTFKFGQLKFGHRLHTQAVAFRLINHTAAFGKLPANLQSDLKTLEEAAASDRDGDATQIKGTALNGGYGDQIQKEAKALQTRLAQAPATAKP